MSVVRCLTDWLLPRRRKAHDVDASMSAAMAEGEKTREAAREVAASSRVERSEAADLAGVVQKRLALIEGRRERRQADPRLTVVYETIRILEGRR
jgi:hypothetical protein